jgi:D-3-phosphoglycerate dehydrogenase
MKILVADKFPEQSLADLAALGVRVEYQPDVPVKDLAAAAAEAAVLIVRSKKVPAEVFEAAPALSLVIRAGAGVNTIDVAAASRGGVYVANCPGQNAIAVAELAIGLTLAIDRRIPDNVQALREGRWDKKAFSEANGLFGRAFGVAGLGSIGLETARRAAALGMRVHAWSRSLDDAKARALGLERAPDLETLASRVDVLSLHLPLKPETRGAVSRAVLERLRPGAILINTARAEVVDHDALLELARAGRIRIGADVHQGEPESGRTEFQSELAKLPNVYGTHHIGASTEQAQEAIAREAVRIVEAFMRGGAVPNCVNIAKKTPARAKLVVRHHDRAGVLANVFDAIRQAGINAQTVENTVFEQATAACCTIELDERPSPEVLGQIRSRRDEVISVDCFDL